MPPHPHPSPMERVLNLPELATAIGFRLPQEDLYACTLVCRHWHDVFIPILWHTIDDKTGSWSDILRYHDDYTCHQGFDEYWLQGIFRKYGHHIRHLSAEWAAVIIAASESGVGTNLLSFKTDNVDKKWTDKQLERNAQDPPAFDTFRNPFHNPDPSLHPSDPNYHSSFCEYWPPSTTPSTPIPPYHAFGATTQQQPASGSSKISPFSFSSFFKRSPPAPSATVSSQAADASTRTTTQSASTSSYSTPLTSTLPTPSPPFLNLAPQTAREAAKRQRGVKQVINYGNTLFQQHLTTHPEHKHHLPFYNYTSPTLVGVFSYPDLALTSLCGYRIPNMFEQYWEAHRHIWLLVRSNFRSLQCLVLDNGNKFKAPMDSGELIYTTLGRAKNLTELEMLQKWISLPRLLDVVTCLQRLTTLGLMEFRAIAEEEEQQRRQQQQQYQPRWPNFRGLVVKRTVENNELLWLLRCFSSLEDLEVKWEYRRGQVFHPEYGQERNISKTYSEMDPSTWLDIKAILFETTQQEPLKLKRLHLNLTERADPLLPVLLPYLPSLTELIIPHLDRDIANALVTHCPGLQIFRIDIGPHDYFYRPSARNKNWVPESNVANILLANCRELQVFEGSAHTIEIEALHGQPPWVCASKLQVLRCQFVGFEKLDDDEQLAFETASLQSHGLDFTDHDGDNNSNNNHNTKDEGGDKGIADKVDDDIRMSVYQEKYERSKSQHTLFFKTLSRLHNLRILDLGPNSISVLYHPPNTTNEQQKRQPIKEDNHHVLVVPGTPSLTLEYGLSYLSTLQRLRVFNFEAVDHRLERKDIIWMATHLGELRHVHGLHVAVPDPYYYATSYQGSLDFRRVMLRTEFEKQRASVQHDGQRM